MKTNQLLHNCNVSDHTEISIRPLAVWLEVKSEVSERNYHQLDFYCIVLLVLTWQLVSSLVHYKHWLWCLEDGRRLWRLWRPRDDLHDWLRLTVVRRPPCPPSALHSRPDRGVPPPPHTFTTTGHLQVQDCGDTSCWQQLFFLAYFRMVGFLARKGTIICTF